MSKRVFFNQVDDFVKQGTRTQSKQSESETESASTFDADFVDPAELDEIPSLTILQRLKSKGSQELYKKNVIST